MQSFPDKTPRKGWPGWLRVLLSLAVVVVVFWLYAGWHWSSRVGSGPGVTFSPTGAYVGKSSAMALSVEYLSERLQHSWFVHLGIHGFWHLGYTLGTVFPASLLAVLTYAALTRRLGHPVFDGYARCRRCNYILRGLSKPRCTECGERI